MCEVTMLTCLCLQPGLTLSACGLLQLFWGFFFGGGWVMIYGVGLFGGRESKELVSFSLWRKRVRS